jgi:hypothetical protein
MRLETAHTMGGGGRHNDALNPFEFTEQVQGGLPLPPWRLPRIATEKSGGIAAVFAQSLLR